MTFNDNQINQSPRRQDESYKFEEVDLKITTSIPNIQDEEKKVEPKDVILSYAEILNNPKNLTYADISKIERNFKSLDVKTENEKLLLNNSLEYLEFLKTSLLTTGDLFCIDFSKENILKKTWAPQTKATKATQTEATQPETTKVSRAMETIIEASPRSENPSINDPLYRVGLEISVSPFSVSPVPISLQSDNPIIISSSPTSTMQDFHLMQVTNQVEGNSDSLGNKTPVNAEVPAVVFANELSPYSQIKTPTLQNQAELRVSASLGYVISLKPEVDSENHNSEQLTPSPKTTQRAFFQEGASNSTGCAAGLRGLFRGR